jgi:hypothetical protein
MKSAQRRIMKLKDSLHELAELGSPVDLAVAEAESNGRELEIEQSGGVCENRVFELEGGRIGYMADICITNQTARPMYVADVELCTPWEEDLFDWLVPQTITVTARKSKKSYSYEQYKFPGKNGLDLPTTKVINHALTFGKSLPPRRPICGWLLATGGFMPRNLLHGGWVDLTLVITTTDHAKYSERVHLWTERLEHRAPSSAPKPENRGLRQNQLREHEISNGREGTAQNCRPSGEPPHAGISAAINLR